MREAVSSIHRSTMAFIASTLKAAQIAHIANLEIEANPANLQAAVEQVLTQAAQPDLAESFGLPKPLTTPISAATIKGRVDELYASIYGKLNAKLAADKAASDKSKVVDDANLAAIAAKTPGELLNQLVQQSVSAQLNQAGYAHDADMSNDQVDPGDILDAIVPKNASSPPAGVGLKNQRARGKFVQPSPKAAATSKAAGMGKGKGSRHKGNRKGKGKHSATTGRDGGK